jgi:cytochrome c-type biogenesis protein CcmH
MGAVAITSVAGFVMKPCLLLGMLLWLSIPMLGHTEVLYPLDNAKQTAQFKGLLRELRCLVCQNQDLADSNAPLAKDLRDEVYRLVQSGQSDTEIVHYLTVRYGDFILFKPPVKSITWLLWGAPILFLSIGCILLWRRTRHA